MNEIEQLLNRLRSLGLLMPDEEKMYPLTLLKIEEALAEKTDYIKFIEQYNRITGKKYRPDVESRRLFYENESIYTLQDRIRALQNCLTDPWLKNPERIGMVTPSFICKPENIGKYVNYEYNKTINGKQSRDENDKGKTKRKAVV